MGLVHRHALRFVDGRGIAVIDVVVVVQVERDMTSIVERTDIDACSLTCSTIAERTVPYAKASVVL